MSIHEYSNEKLWPILVDTTHKLVMYPHHKAYIRDIIVPEKPEISPPELASRFNMPLGEALVILYELEIEKKTQISNSQAK